MPKKMDIERQTRFDEIVAEMPSLLETLQNCEPKPIRCVGGLKGVKAIYAFYDKSDSDKPVKPRYVGRTRNLQARIRGHMGKSHYSATFAFKQAREKHDKAATYCKGKSRAELMECRQFLDAFDCYRKEVSNMNFRYVEINDPLEQYMFELYAALALGTSLSEFETS